MNKQLARIEEFVSSVASRQMTDEQQSMVLSASVNVVGGSNNGGQCTNYSEGSCGGVNRRCTNHGVCGTADFTFHKVGDCMLVLKILLKLIMTLGCRTVVSLCNPVIYSAGQF